MMYYRRYRWDCKKKLKNEHFDPLIDEKPISFEEKYAKVAPEMKNSVALTNPDHWDIGSLMTCEKIKIEPGYDTSPSIVCQWTDHGSTYCLRKRSVPKSELGDGDCDSEAGHVYDVATSGVWTLSPNVFCKTQRWTEGTTTDAESIRFVNKNIPSIPTEKIIYDWIDHQWHRWFMLSWRVPGERFYEAWPQLSLSQKLDVAQGVAGHSKALAAFTSSYIETVTGQGPEGKFRLGLRDSLPEWKPRIEPRATREEYKQVMERSWARKNLVPPDPEASFALSHCDLIPQNIFVDIPKAPENGQPEKEAKVTAIIDWQRLAYRSKWEVATLPRAMWSYAVYNQPDGRDWQWMLSNALYDEGFPLELDSMRKATNKMMFCNIVLPWEREDNKDNEQEDTQEEIENNNKEESL
jgi:hypothetical protein